MSNLETRDKFIKFWEDEEAADMYIIGAGGTGKTTDLALSVQWCIDNEIPYIICAYTHKACGIVRSKMPPGANIRTLHSFLKKRPVINTDATNVAHVTTNIRTGEADEEPQVLFLDEYSMVGEKDYCDIADAQYGDQEMPKLKVVWLGDDYQLPPVGDVSVIQPHGKHVVRLTKQYRNDNPLQGPLVKLRNYIDGTEVPAPLEPVPGYFERGLDLVNAYRAGPEDKALLAFTNERVQYLNSLIAGKERATEGDRLFSPTTQHNYTLVQWLHPQEVTYIDVHYSEPLELGSKYKTLENLINTGLCDFAQVVDDEGHEYIFATVFGHYDYKVTKENLEQAAVQSNQAIEKKFKDTKAAAWARANNGTSLARSRAKAWRDCLSFKDCTICLDFPYAMTVHKSQGSTYDAVYVDTDDIGKCANINFDVYLKLMYVAISRASNYVGTN